MLFLTLSTFSSTGGIQKVTRSIAHALSRLSQDQKEFGFKMLALNDDVADERYIDHNNFTGFRNNRIAFAIRAVFLGINSNTILISHINLLPLAALMMILRSSLKIVMLAHGVEVWRGIANWKRRFINKHINVWAVSDFTAQHLIDHQGIDPDRIMIVNNCLDPFFEIPVSLNKPHKLLEKYQLSNDQFIIVTISRLTKYDSEKGYDKILEILPKLLPKYPGIRYLICGLSHQQEKTRLQNLINKYKLQEYVKLLGFIKEEELTSHYLLADLFALPSKKEGFGIVFIEAAACGCKIISGNSDGSRDAMLKGKLGTMIDPDNTDELKQAIVNHLEKDKTCHDAKHIQDACLGNFSHEQFIMKVKNIVES